MSYNIVQTSKESSIEVNLLVSILIRYPQISSINFETDSNSLNLTFLINQDLSNETHLEIKDLIEKSMNFYHDLKNIENKFFNVKITTFDKITLINIIRDVPTLSCNEISLIIKLLDNQFNDDLISDMLSDDLSNIEDIINHDKIIEDLLNNMGRKATINKNLVGIREDGRVFVFNK